MKYKKTFSANKYLHSGGPRDQQRRQNDDSELIASLKEQISLLKEQPVTKGLTNEQIDEEIIKAVQEETVKYRERIKALESEVIQLKGSIENKDVLIEQLKQIKVVVPAEKSDYDEVEIDPVYVDPIEKDFEPLEEHLDIDTTLTVTKKGMDDKVDKLRALLGKM